MDPLITGTLVIFPCECTHGNDCPFFLRIDWRCYRLVNQRALLFLQKCDHLMLRGNDPFDPPVGVCKVLDDGNLLIARWHGNRERPYSSRGDVDDHRPRRAPRLLAPKAGAVEYEAQISRMDIRARTEHDDVSTSND